MKEKQDLSGNTVILKDTTIKFYKDFKLFKIQKFLTPEEAKIEYNRITNTRKGCGRNIWRQREVMERWLFYIPKH